MKGRLQNLLFKDQLRLPLLALVPQRGSVEDLPKLRAALSARLESVSEREGEGRRTGTVRLSEQSYGEREEREMLKAALDWIALQDDQG